MTDYERGLRKAEEICRRIMREADDLTADTEEYRLGNWAGAEKCAWAIACEAKN